MNEIAKKMTKISGVTIDPELVVKLPSDGCPGHLFCTKWEVYAARCGEFTILLYEYEDGRVTVKMI